MNSQRLNIILPYDVIKQLDKEVPQGKRSKFIANAVSEKLKKKRDIKKALRESLKANRTFDETVMKDWSVTEVEGWPDYS